MNLKRRRKRKKKSNILKSGDNVYETVNKVTRKISSAISDQSNENRCAGSNIIATRRQGQTGHTLVRIHLIVFERRIKSIPNVVRVLRDTLYIMMHFFPINKKWRDSWCIRRIPEAIAQPYLQQLFLYHLLAHRYVVNSQQRVNIRIVQRTCSTLVSSRTNFSSASTKISPFNSYSIGRAR